MANRNEWNGKSCCYLLNNTIYLFTCFIESLCGCCDDCSSCCYGCWCTPCLFGSNAEKIDDSSCFLMCCAYFWLSSCYLCCIPHYMKRKDLRNKYALRKDPCGDFPVALCCSPCGLCQEARFLKRAGIFKYRIEIIYFIILLNLGQQQFAMQGGVPHMVQPGRNY
jgi:Cys-rich protein (TIGR01571 family)